MRSPCTSILSRVVVCGSGFGPEATSAATALAGKTAQLVRTAGNREWYDTATGELVPEADIADRYHDVVVENCGIRRYADAFEMTDRLGDLIGSCSHGMRQKIALMRTLLHDPPVLLLDEPTSAMDPESARLVRDAILQMSAQARHTTIVCTHNLPEAEELSDRIAIISHGRIVVQGTAAELKSRLLGPPVMELRVRAGSVDLRDGVLSLVKQFVTVEGVGDGWVHYRTSDPAVVNPILLGALAEARVPVVTLSELPQSLESVYLQVIEEEGIRGSTG